MTLAPRMERGFFIGLRLEKMLKPEQIDEILNIFICGLFAAIGGGLSYLDGVRKGKMFRVAEFLLQLAISAMAGVITYQITQFFGAPVNLSGALCGAAGWFGTLAMQVIKYLFLKRLGIDKKTLSELDDEGKQQ